MLSFLVRRVVFAGVVFGFVTFFIWLLTTHYGIATVDPHAPPPTVNTTALAGVTYQYTSYWGWLGEVLRGNFGYSVSEREPLNTLIGARIGATLLLVIPALILQEIIGVTLGIFMAAHSGKLGQRLITTLQYLFAAMPAFWLSLMAIIFVSGTIHWFSFNGLVDERLSGSGWGTAAYAAYFRTHPLIAMQDIVQHLALPIIVLVLGNMVSNSQLIRTAMLEVLQQDYIRAARARGIRERVILWRHALRNAILPYITNVGLQFPRLVFMAALVESVFNLPGLGAFFIRSVELALPDPNAAPNSQPPNVLHPLDPSVITTYLLIFGVITLISTLITDITYSFADPRIRTSG